MVVAGIAARTDFASQLRLVLELAHRPEEKEALASLAKKADIERRAREQAETDRREAEERVKARSDEAS